MQMVEPYQVVTAAQCDPWSSCGGKAPVFLELLSRKEATILLRDPDACRRQSIAPAAEQTAVLPQRRSGCCVEEKQQLHRAGNGTQNHRLPSRWTATSHKTHTLHSVARCVHHVTLFVTVKHLVVKPISCAALLTATVQSQHCSILLKPQ